MIKDKYTLAERIRALPFAAGSRDGKRQAWMRECAACLVEDKPLPPDPTLEKKVPKEGWVCNRVLEITGHVRCTLPDGHEGPCDY